MSLGTNIPASGSGRRRGSGRRGHIKRRVDGGGRPEKTFMILHTNDLHSNLIGMAQALAYSFSFPQQTHESGAKRQILTTGARLAMNL